MSILVINAGSSSIKYTLYRTHSLERITHGLIEEVTNHHDAFVKMEQELLSHGYDFTKIEAFGHRVVHGGDRFDGPARIDERVLVEIESLCRLAPLHNPANLEGIYAGRHMAPDVPHVAVFDTAFHQTIPAYAYRYPLPKRFYESDRIRRYGFHGTSHRYVAHEAAKTLGKPLETLKLITLHIGNGVSACAIRNGESVDTTMGMTPLEGLMMGTRCGSIDPAIVEYLVREKKMSIDEIDSLLNKRSGLLGIGGSSDMRVLLANAAEGSEEAQLAIEMFVYRIKKQIGAYLAALNGADAIVFTGGIGEHAAPIRSQICEGLAFCGIGLDDEKNQTHERFIHTADSTLGVMIVPTDEELSIAMQVKETVRSLDD
ncbi:MAG: acetate/propionate family kinase [Sulfuricurvum sp.]